VALMFAGLPDRHILIDYGYSTRSKWLSKSIYLLKIISQTALTLSLGVFQLVQELLQLEYLK
jgi:hypothetical protein